MLSFGLVGIMRDLNLNLQIQHKNIVGLCFYFNTKDCKCFA